jgi:hypothetical protein
MGLGRTTSLTSNKRATKSRPGWYLPAVGIGAMHGLTPVYLFSGNNLEPWSAVCVGGDAVLRFTCRFGGWKNHTRQLDSPVGLPPSTRGRSTESNGQRRIGRYRLFTTFISSLPSWPRTAQDRVPHHPATPRRWAELMPPFADPGAALPNKSYTKTRISPQTCYA